MIHNYSSNSNLKRIAKALSKGYNGGMKKTAQEEETASWYDEPKYDREVPYHGDDLQYDSQNRERSNKHKEAVKYGLDRLPGWLQAWIIRAEKEKAKGIDGGNISISEAIQNTMPPDDGKISESQFVWGEKVIDDVMRNHYSVMQEHWKEDLEG